MTTYEWLTLIGVLLAGFWTIATKLSSIEKALMNKVSYEDCSHKRDTCPCMQELNRRIANMTNNSAIRR